MGLRNLPRHDPALLPEVLDLLRILSRSGTPAMRARGRILLKKLESGRERPPRGTSAHRLIHCPRKEFRTKSMPQSHD
jgi:hypothetical protein